MSPSRGTRQFLGFQPPTSNTVYTPNQFFDVCLPHSSRGCVRLVGYIIRRVLGWSDKDGNPLEEQVSISFNDLIKDAGISREMVRSALDEAIERGFIECIREGKPSRSGEPSVPSLYELRWNESAPYSREPDSFRGFYAGEGNRTYIPNQFFDEVIRAESLSVIKVVGAVIRHSIGFQTKHGFRRQHAKLSYSTIQRYTRIASTSTLATAIQTALDRNYIVKVQQGLFTSDFRDQITTTYSLKWSDKSPYHLISQKNEVEKNPLLDRSENRSSTSPKSEVENRSENRSTKEITNKNNSSKQHSSAFAEPAVAEELVSRMKEVGLSSRDAESLVKTYPEKLIRQQIHWLPKRHPRNPAGMLRRAIKDEWSAPIGTRIPTAAEVHGAAFAAAYYAGYAGNENECTAQPSHTEIEAANSYLERIFSMWPGTERSQEHGFRFGKYVRKHKPPTKEFRTAFLMALRLFGDEFYKYLNQQRVIEISQRIAERRAAHEETYADAYWEFVAAENETFQRNKPERYAEFRAERLRAREFILNNRYIRSDERRQQQLQKHDSQTNHLRAFREFFSEEVPDFWDWDREHNPDPFHGGEQQ